MIPAVLRHAGLFARLLTLACSVAAAGTAHGQSSSTPPGAPSTAPKTAPGTAPSPFGAITGIVVDSLHGRPLAGAQISVEGLNTLGMTDSAGRFRIDSVPPGKYRIGVFHPLLDSLALSIASPQLRVAADSTLSVIFATPSAVTFIGLVCGPIQIDTMAGIGPSVVVGRVLDAETEAPAAGIKVTLSWTDIQVGAKIGVRRIQRTRDTTTGPSGGFRFCHLPPSINGVARAIVSTADSGAVSRPVAINGRLVVPLVLHVPGTAKPATGTHGTASSDGSAPASIAPSPGSVLTGRIMRSDGTGPVAGAQR
jgi:Carboxypeptidase regulatory-like domain